MSKEYGQKDMPDMRKLQASNTQTSDAACFFLVKNIRTKTQKLSKHHGLLNPSSLFLLNIRDLIPFSGFVTELSAINVNIRSIKASLQEEKKRYQICCN